MAIDDRVTVDVGDVFAVELACSKCQTTLSVPVDRWSPSQIQGRCPTCAEFWWGGQSVDTGKTLDALARALKALRGLGGDSLFRVGLQVPRPTK
jgi:hypothetical protein